MRAVLDANVLISYLLAPELNSAASQLVRIALSQSFELTVSEPAFEEVLRSVERKPYLRALIPSATASRLIGALTAVAVEVVPLSAHLERMVRDKDDDFLTDPALLLHTDVVISGDKDVLEITAIDHVRYVSPSEFLLLLMLEKY